MESALVALAVLGRPLPQPDVPEPTRRSLLDHLAPPGAAARWQVRFTPVLMASADPSTCNTRAWAHVPDELRQALLNGSADVLAERVASSASPLRLPPPPAEGGTVQIQGGCLMCGVSHVVMDAARVTRLGGRVAAALSAWRAVMVTHRAARLSGHLCPDCQEARRAVGGTLGPSAVERAVLAHLDATGQEERTATLGARISDGDPPALPLFGVGKSRSGKLP